MNFTLSKANGHEQVTIVETSDGIHIGKRRRRPKRLGLDKGYDRDPLRQALRRRRIVPLVPYRRNRKRAPSEVPAKERHEKRYCRQRWKVERAFSWLNNRRRLDRMLEHGQKAYRAFMRVVFVQHYLKALFS